MKLPQIYAEKIFSCHVLFELNSTTIDGSEII